MLLVKREHLTNLADQPQLRLALQRTQTESSVNEMLERFANLEDVVNAYDELRK